MVAYSVEFPQLTQLQAAFAQAPQLTAQTVIDAGNTSLLDYLTWDETKQIMELASASSTDSADPTSWIGG